MTEMGCFLTGLAICSLVVLTIIIVIHRRFSVMMIDLCEGEERARFWSLAVEAWFALYSLGSALKWRPEGTAERQMFLAVVEQVKTGLHGASNAIVLFSTGLIVFVLIRKFKGSEDTILGRKSA